MAHQFFNPDIENAVPGDIIELSGSEAHHAQSVSRLRKGEKIRIGNGRGLLLLCEVTELTKKTLHARIEKAVFTEKSEPELILVQALAKTDRDLRAIEASTELGIDTVIPWSAMRSISKWEGEKISKGHSKWTITVTEAAKQSLRSWIPSVGDYSDTPQVINTLNNCQIIVLEPTAPMRLSEITLKHHPIALVVGPEGGISEEEREMFSKAGANEYSLGPHVLRTSTAGPAALSILNAQLGRC